MAKSLVIKEPKIGLFDFPSATGFPGGCFSSKTVAAEVAVTVAAPD
jgi:hypothetical protein